MAGIPTRRTARTSRVELRAKPAPISATLLAEQLAGLSVSNAKTRQKVTVPPSQEELRVSAMKEVNSASQALSGLVKSGWKRSSGKPLSVATTATTAAASAAKHLAMLRQMSPDDLDVERAAMSVLGKLLALELYDDALAALQDIHAQLCSLNRVARPTSDGSTRSHLLSIPLSSKTTDDDSTLLMLVSTYLAYALMIVIQITCTAQNQKDDLPGLVGLVGALSHDKPTLLVWLPVLSSLPAKKLDPLLTRTYTTTIRACTTCNSNPREIFLLRIYAVACLTYTSAGTVETTTFWDQVITFGRAFSKSQMSSEEAIHVVLSAFYGLVDQIQKRDSGSALLSGKAFVGFCEFWIIFAKKAGDICLVDRIADLIRGASSSSTEHSLQETEGSAEQADQHESQQSEDRKRPKDYALEAARMCAAFAQMTTALEQNALDINKRLQETTDYLRNANVLRELVKERSSGDEESVRISGKIDKALERMRRVAVRCLDSSVFNSLDDTREGVCFMLEAIVEILFPLCSTSSPDSVILTRTLDTLFILAKTKLRAADPRTYVPAHGYLTKATAIVEQISDPLIDTPNYVRCISGAFHNIAGILYQAGRHGTTIGFAKDSCTLGVKALEMRRARMGVGQDDLMKGEDGRAGEGWKQLEEQVYRRWELLAVCYMKIGERKHSLGAYMECIKTFPYSLSGLAQLTAEMSLDAVFDLSSGTKQLATIIDRVTHLSASELLMEASLVSLGSVGIEDSAIVGALLERQIDCLETSRWKEDVRSIVAHLLEDALKVYSPHMPVRRARVLVRCLEFTYYVGPEYMTGVGNPVEIAGEVVELLQQKNFERDANLVQFCGQYRATAHLWLALHAHRRVDPGQNSLMSYHSDEACKILKALISEMSESKRTPRKSPPKQISATKKSALRQPVSRQRSTKKIIVQDPVTPKRKSRKVSQPMPSNVVTPPRSTKAATRSTVIFDNFEKFLSLLRLTARISGFLALILPKVHLLDVARSLCEYQLGLQSDGHILSSMDLAHEYVMLGKTKRAVTIFNRALDAVKSKKASNEVSVLFFLRFAESLASSEDVPRSSDIYCEALALSEKVHIEDKSLPMIRRVQERVKRLEKAAIAARVVALIQYSKEDVTACIDGMLQSLRLWNRAIDTLTRLHPPATSPPGTTLDNNPFEVPKNVSPKEPSQPKTFLRRASMDGFEWQISEELLATLFSLTQAYLDRGSVREAEYFSQQAQDLAESLNAPTMVSRALAKKGEIQLYQLQFEASLETLVKAGELSQNIPGIDNIDVRRLRGIHNERMALQMDASEIYEDTLNMIDELDQAFKQFDGFAFGRKSIGSSPNFSKKATEVIFPERLATILRQHIWLLRDKNVEDYTAFLDRFFSLPHSSRTKAEENALMAKLTLHAAYGRFRGDMFLSSLAESTIALPMGMSSRMGLTLSASTQDILVTLDAAERLFWSNLNFIAKRGRVTDVREAVVSLALIQAFQSFLGKSGKGGSTLAAGLLDASAAITLRREMLETIQQKFLKAHDDIQWPVISSDGPPLPQPKAKKTSARFSFDDDVISEDDLDNDQAPLEEYWEATQTRYQSYMLDPSSLSSTQMAELPSNWTIIHINVTEDKNTLFITRQECGGEESTPLMFCVPLKGRRDDGRGADNEEHLTFEDAINELREIIKLSDQGTKAAVFVKSDDPEARTAWWKDRRDLDVRLRELLENIEFCWLGAFKTILSPRPNLPPELISDLRSQFERVFLQSLHVQDKKIKHSRTHKKSSSQSQSRTPSQISFDDALLKCFSTLSPKCKDEELEDLIYFILDLYQFHGVPVAIAEVDVTQVVVDLRSVLEDHGQKLSRQKASKGQPRSAEQLMDEHIFLVLDKNLQGLPWESIPILRGRSVSRIPSVDFLYDRVLFARWKHDSLGGDTTASLKGAVVDPRKGYFILNPSGDLHRTEDRFKAWTREMQEVGWEGITGHPPSEQQFLNALRDRDLVVYFGHGGGEQYLRSHKIRNLPICAATMLWGCSSGALREMGDFDRIGTPYNYMLAGCPTLVANLWDVTDGDIDKFSQSVFDKLRLNANGVRQWGAEGHKDSQKTSIMAAVGQSRDCCKLKYLTGAAPIIYGIPFYL